MTPSPSVERQRAIIVKALRLFLRHQEYDCDCRGCTDIIEALTPEEPRRTMKRVVGRRIVEVPIPRRTPFLRGGKD